MENENEPIEVEEPEKPEQAELERMMALQRKWRKVIEDRTPAYRNYWQRADAVVQRFEDERDTGAYKGAVPNRIATARQYNMLWANTETLQPVLFNKVPDPVVKRRWSDASPVARSAAEMLERVATLNASREDVYFVDHVNAGVFNLLVPGTGLLWARYAPEVSPEGVGDQKIIAEYVHWRDFMASKANAWSQVTWIARKLYWSKERVEARWGPEAAQECTPEKKEGERDDKAPPVCEILEIWDKTTKTVLFFNKDATRILEVKDDPLRLSCFYPCPKPLFAVWSTADVIPIPLYCQYQDQARELDQVTTQIYTLLKAARVVGVYNEAMGADFQQMLDEGVDNKMIPVTDWPDFMTKGGMSGNVAMLELGQVVQMLQTLFQAREGIKRDLNEVTGIPDMFRGISSPLDAEGTNQLKVQWGASRVRDMQRDVQRLCKDWLGISAEIAAEHFTDENLARMSGLDLPTRQEKMMLELQVAQLQMQGQNSIPDEIQERLGMPAMEEVIGLLRSDKLRGFMLDIESDSTIEGDDAKEREDRSQFIEVLTGMVERWAPIVSASPQMLPMVKELVMFAIRPFRAGRGLEETVERTFEQLEQAAKAAAQAPPQPDPMDKAIQAEMQKVQLQEVGDTQREQMSQAGQTERKVMDIAAKDSENRVKAIAEVAKQVVAGE